jgi:hypothetical protein
VAGDRRRNPVDLRDVQSQPNYQSALLSPTQRLKIGAKNLLGIGIIL